MRHGLINDLAANARVLPATLPTGGTGSLRWATKDRPVAQPPRSVNDLPEVWHRWIAPSDGWVAAGTSGPDFGLNLGIFVYEGIPSSSNLLAERGLWMAKSGQEYWIAVIALGNEWYQLNLWPLSSTPTPLISLESMDLFPRVVDVTQGNGTVSVNGTARLGQGWICSQVVIRLSDDPYFEPVTVIPVSLPDGIISYSARLPVSQWHKASLNNITLTFHLARENSPSVTTGTIFTVNPSHFFQTMPSIQFPEGINPGIEIINRSPADVSGPLLLRFAQVSPPPDVQSGPGEFVIEVDIREDRAGFDPVLTSAFDVTLVHNGTLIKQPTATITRVSRDAFSGA